MPFTQAAASAIDAAITSATSNPYFDLPRAVVMVANKDEVLYTGSGGFKTLPPFDDTAVEKEVLDQSPKVDENSIFDLFSCTKLIAVIAALQCVERGLFNLTDDAGLYVEDIKTVPILTGFDEEKGGEPILVENDKVITVEMLITHTAGFGYYFNPKLARYEAWVEKTTGQPPIDPYSPKSTRKLFASTPLLNVPGEHWCYGTSNDWLTLVVEKVTGQDLESYFQQNIFQPLGIKDISFLTNPEKIDLALSGTPDPLVNSYRFTQTHHEFNQSHHLGGAGLSGSPASYLRIIQTLLLPSEGEGGRNPLLTQESLDTMFQSHLPLPQHRSDVTTLTKSIIHPWSFSDPNPAGKEAFPGTWGYGGFLTESELPSGRKRGTLSWSGMANTFWVVDRETGVCFVIFTNSLPSRPPQLWPFWEKVETAIYQGFSQE